ncbi:MAG: tyrosine-protein phosphatase [Oscillospiraceae bacterium]|nr:tyrosine-protein phosphatase [Oscillospiraceae bacterium]
MNTKPILSDEERGKYIRLTGDLNGSKNVAVNRPCILEYMHKNYSSITKDTIFDLTKPNEGITHPVETPVTWKSSLRRRDVKYHVEISTHDNFEDSVVFNGKADYPSQSTDNKNRIFITNLMIRRKYFFRVVGECKNGDRFCSETGEFTTDGTPARFVNWGDASNSRDAGGWKTVDGKYVRQGMLYRSGRLQNTNGDPVIDQETQHYIINNFGLKTDVDLRGIWKDTLSVTKSLNGMMELVSAPISAYSDTFTNPETKNGLKIIFKTFADKSKYPMYIHCHGGADRTGIIIFLLNGLLGVSLEDLIRDYELTSFASIEDIRYRGSDQMAGFVNTLKDYGKVNGSDDLKKTIEHWLTDYVGVSAKEIDDIRNILLEP